MNQKIAFSYQARYRGFALVEILVSIIVLTIGILALLAAQLRSVSSVREAEGQTIAAQATANLSEAMQANPTLSLDGSVTKKTFDAYLGADSDIAGNCNANLQTGTAYSQADLATFHLCSFKSQLESGMPDSTVNFTVCADSSLTKPVVSAGNIDYKCNNSGDTVIKVVWQVQNASDDANNTQNSNQTVYTYQTYVKAE